jgi:hypothetical protein
MLVTNRTWLGKAFCTVDRARPEYKQGHRGAVFVFACIADTLQSCVESITNEMVEHDLTLRGFEYLMDSEYMDRHLSEYEQELVERLRNYPVQFENVHFFPPEG